MYRKHAKGHTSVLRLHGGKIRAQTKFSDGTERVEEWEHREVCSRNSSDQSQRTRAKKREMVLLLRKWRTGTDGLSLPSLSSGSLPTPWEYEIGDCSVAKKQAGRRGHTSSTMMSRSSCNPAWLAEDSETKFVYKVTNCPWPLKNYHVSTDEGSQEIILRTANRKYFKRFQIPALARLNEPLSYENISMEHDKRDSTLVISYLKTKRVLEYEEEERKEREEAMAKLVKDGDVECKQS